MAYQFELVIAILQRGAFWGHHQQRDIRMLREIQEKERIQVTSTWVLLRDSTMTNILNGRITQLDSAAITAVTLSNNIPRRSMEFVTADINPQPLDNPYNNVYEDYDEDAWHDDDDGNDDENNNYEEEEHHNQHHYEDDNRHYHYLEDDRTYYGGYSTDI
jgi:hypothetical protein